MCQNCFNPWFSSIAGTLHSRCTSSLNFAVQLSFPPLWTEHVWSETSCSFCGTRAVSSPANSPAGKRHFWILLLPSVGVSQLLPQPFPNPPPPSTRFYRRLFVPRRFMAPVAVLCWWELPRQAQTPAQPLARRRHAGDGDSHSGTLAPASPSPFPKQGRDFAQTGSTPLGLQSEGSPWLEQRQHRAEAGGGFFFLG